MSEYDLAVLWEWHFDVPFNDLLKRHASLHEKKILFVCPDNLEEVHNLVVEKKIIINWILDRASETDPVFLPFVKTCHKMKINSINYHSYVMQALDKALMQKTLEKLNLPLPETIILPSYNSCKKMPFVSFENIGIPFVVKPSSEGGGEGVHMGVTELYQIAIFRKEFPDQKYLIQQTIVPKVLTKYPLWIRGYHVGEDVHLMFWNPETKIFSAICNGDLSPSLKDEVNDILFQIAYESKLKFFSTEVAITNENRPIVIDYVNDPVDLRPLSLHIDGIPDKLVEKIIVSLLRFIS